jgi:2,4-dienoyl-CoA reductase-like NADH-dependent reductase (Old Yellow Enzyme family)
MLQLLQEPFQVGSLTLANRWVMAPMTRCFCPAGIPGPDVAAYYRRRAEAGVGLIVTEGTWIPHAAASNEDSAPRFYGDDALNGWRRVVEEVHAVGGKVIPQLWHVGLTRKPVVEHLYAAVREDLSKRVSPSGYVMPDEKVAEGMTSLEIEDVINAYAEGARTAERLGFDGVEIHGAHGYLVDQFLWHKTNRRGDRWGGNLAGRGTFAVEMIRACRSRVSADFPIVLRFSQWKLQEYAGTLAATPQELESLLAPLALAGVDVFHASQRRFWEPQFPGSTLNLAGWARRLTGRPTITVGSVGLEREMLETMFSADESPVARLDRLEEMLERREFDLVAVGRALLSDPQWTDKVRRGAWHELLPYRPAALSNLT